MFDIKVFKDDGKTFNPWTFSVDGQNSGMWCPNEHAARRIVNRLLQGKSREAFGGAVAVSAGAGVSAQNQGGRGKVYQSEEKIEPKIRKLGSGKEKTASTKTVWVAEVDGKEVGKYENERDARVACAVKAFMSRGKLGRLKEAEEKFKELHGKAATVTYDGKTVKAVTKSGEEYAVGLTPGREPYFKPLLMQEPEED